MIGRARNRDSRPLYKVESIDRKKKKPLKTFDANRHCTICGATLSVYNPGTVCFHHTNSKYDGYGFLEPN